ncbi:MAG: HD domain-containing protein [Deltaproteobacteria bacterium]|nr:MAG: HD domain-containing protein [Deltaproteobacteria bacterium]
MERERIDVKRERFRLQAVEDLTRGVTRERELEDSVRYALHAIMGALGVKRGIIIVLNGPQVEVHCSRGVTLEGEIEAFPEEVLSFLGRREVPFIYESENTPPEVKRALEPLTEPLGREVLLSPLRAGRVFAGVVLLGDKVDGNGYSRKDRELVAVMSRFIAAEVNSRLSIEELTRLNAALSQKIEENVRLITSLQSVYFQTIMALATAIDAKDPYTRGHSERVAKISRAIARSLDLSPEEIRAVYMAGILHDIGKISTGKEILSKRGALTDDERETVRRHPEVSYRILSKVKFPHRGIPEFALHHHEWFDGSGYPSGLKGEEIPIGARIISLADAFDAMITDRPYRRGKTLTEAIKEIVRYSGTQFDPAVVKAFLRVLREEFSSPEKRKEVISAVPRRVASEFSPHIITEYLGEAG